MSDETLLGMERFELPWLPKLRAIVLVLSGPTALGERELD